MQNTSGGSRKKTKPLQVDYKKLEQDLQSQIHEDELYWLRNDAKLRAVTQGTPTYEDFRQIVMAAHLKPVSKEEKEEMQRKSMQGKVIWNSLVDEKKCAEGGGDNDEAEEKSGIAPVNKLVVFNVPKNNADFIKTWKNLSSCEEKLAYAIFLANSEEPEGKGDAASADPPGTTSFALTKSTLGRICVEEFPPDIFPELIKCIYNDMVTVTPDDMVFNEHSKFDGTEKIRNERWKDILQILYIVAQTKRFKISISFLTEEQRNQSAEIITRLGKKVAKQLQSVKEIEGDDKIINELFFTVKRQYFPTNLEDILKFEV